ncbi:flagellar hook-length control protein FliK [Herbaspirillum seropedicae]|nr:flagellar hook-length control protein FliK [Herbaspirillum seropedicae]AKN65593.1 flagellar hook-length control protein FliK [Herbaspirillum seropedicae]NQE28752.1 flagellar hook-length control protein FliK [Herbaspirillum seropedicae]UMU21556.1 flagellar hook-length control protein FliK [Herbaspirillum seropedicae]
MLPRADIASAVHPVNAVEPATAVVSVADTRQEAFSRLAQIAVGQQMSGRILSNFSDGTFLVRIANTAARMVLPNNAKVGDALVLTLVSKDPRPTFSVNEGSIRPDEESASVALSNAGRAMQKDLKSLQFVTRDDAGAGQIAQNEDIAADAQAKGARPGQTGAPASTTTTLSNAARLIDSLLHASQQGDMADHVSAPAPLLPRAGLPPEQMAGALKDAIAYSGVFYESHVSAWAAGQRPAEELLREPQAQVAAKHGGEINLLSQNDPAQNQLGQIINLQLNALEQQRVLWHGEVWPGQKMDWEISQEHGQQESNAQADDEAPPSWHSVVRFDFAHLGGVSASIRLIGQQIHVQVKADNESTAAALRGNSSLFADAMAAAGTSLDSLIVKQSHGET